MTSLRSENVPKDLCKMIIVCSVKHGVDPSIQPAPPPLII